MAECYIDRTGGDITTGASPTYVTLEACVAACDRTSGCEDVSWVPGNPGLCCLKVVPVSNIDVWGAVKRSECTTTAIKAMKRDTTTALFFGHVPSWTLQLWVSPIAVYEKFFEYEMRRGGAANFTGIKKQLAS